MTIGLTGTALVVLVGFIMQNITEGFPIASPFLGRSDRKGTEMATFFLVGGLPTILGGAVGYFYSSGAFTVLFDGLAIGAILYAILPMFKSMFRDSDPRERSASPISGSSSASWSGSWSTLSRRRYLPILRFRFW